MRTLTRLAVALTAVLVPGVAAHAQSAPLSVEGTISPKRAGTKQQPVNTTIDARLAVDAASRLTLDSVEFKLPKTVKVSGRGYPTCTLERITEPGAGESRCPKRSKVGSGSGRGQFQTVPLAFTFNVYVAAPDRAVLVLSSNGTTAAAEGQIRGTTLRIDLPASARSPLPGMYTTIESLEAVIGGSAVTIGDRDRDRDRKSKRDSDSDSDRDRESKRDRDRTSKRDRDRTSKRGRDRTSKRGRERTTGFVTTTGCTGGAHRFGVRLGVSSGGQPRPALSAAVAIPCTKPRRTAP